MLTGAHGLGLGLVTGAQGLGTGFFGGGLGFGFWTGLGCTGGLGLTTGAHGDGLGLTTGAHGLGTGFLGGGEGTGFLTGGGGDGFLTCNARIQGGRVRQGHTHVRMYRRQGTLRDVSGDVESQA